MSQLGEVGDLLEIFFDGGNCLERSRHKIDGAEDSATIKYLIWRQSGVWINGVIDG